MKHYLLGRLAGALILVVGASACITADVQRELDEYKATNERALADLQAGRITQAEFTQQIDDARRDLKDQADAAVQATADRLKESIATATKGPITGNPLTDLLIAAGGAAATAYFGVNAKRNAARRARGERVEVPPAYPRWQPPNLPGGMPGETAP